MEKLVLDFKRDQQRSEIFFGQAVFPLVAKFTAEHFPRQKIAVISDAHVAGLYGTKLLDSLKAHNSPADLITFPEGEASKSRETKAEVEDELFNRGFGRDTLIIALGGGVTGDLAGFVAATFCRGVPCLQVPTTVLAMADSSVGGKTGIDVPAGKNLVGAFHQPEAVFMDPDVLVTLSKRNIRSGLVEIIKHGLIRDKDLFQVIEDNISDLLKPSENPLLFNKILFRSCSIKGKVVKIDEVEGGLRQILNFGHTAGHAVEALSEWKLLHGEAVALGILAAMEISVVLCGLAREKVERAQTLLRRLGTPTTWDFSIREALEIMRHDKKVRKEEVRFVLLNDIGQARKESNWAMPVPTTVISNALEKIGGRN